MKFWLSTLLFAGIALALDKPRLGGYVENATALYADETGSFTDVATLRLEGAWDFSDFGGVETHLLLSAALRPLDPFALLREGSVMRRMFDEVLAAAAMTMDSLMMLEAGSLDPYTQSMLGRLAGMDVEPYMRHLPYSSYWPRNTVTLDRAVVKLFFKPFDLYAGRQVVAWGTGYGWNPTNVWNVKNPADPDAPRVGVNALRLEVPLGAASGLSVVFSPGSDINHSSGGFRLKAHVGRFDVSLSGVRLMNDDQALLGLPARIIAGADIAGELGEIGVWGECAVVNPVSPGGDYRSFDSLYVQADLGLNYTFGNGLFLMGEYYYNGRGRRDPDEYSLLDVIRLMGGEMSGLGRHYAMLGATYTLQDNWGLSLFCLGNLSDASCMLLPSVEYDVRGSIGVKLGAALAFGDREQSEFGGLHHSVALTLTGWF